jgi:WhiB family redox-sensing transcriptional regulator
MTPNWPKASWASKLRLIQLPFRQCGSFQRSTPYARAVQIGDRQAADDLEEFENVVRPPLWMRDAACLEHLDLDWFPERGRCAESARQVCRGCLVRRECAAFALDLAIDIGFWGGATGRQLRRARRLGLSVEEFLAAIDAPSPSGNVPQGQPVVPS